MGTYGSRMKDQLGSLGTQLGTRLSQLKQDIADSREVPVGSFSARLENIVKNNFRGLLGVIVPILAFTWMPEKNVHYLTVWVLWMWMFWYFLIQPIAIPCTAMIPICILPMCGVMSSLETTKCYFNEGVCLFLLSSMLILLWNNSGLDRRLALCFLTSGDNCQFSGKRMIVKCSMAAYFLSMFSNRLIVTSMITQYAAEGYATLKATFKKSAYEPDFDEIRNIVCNSIQTSSSIGSIAIIHSAYATLLFRAIWLEATPLPTHTEYPEIFNYLEYSAYAVPVSLVMYLVNLLYHLWIFNCVISRRMTHPSRGDLRDLMLKHKTTIPKRMTWHEMQALFFSLAALLILFLRWNKYMNMGWADYNLKPFAPEVPLVKDACVVGLFVIALHVLPSSLHFLQFVQADKLSELKDMKPESAILWWRFVDKNTNYAYFFVFGAGVALCKAVRISGLGVVLANNFGKEFTVRHPWCTGLFLVCFMTCLLANVMTGCAVVVCFLPFVINMAVDPAPVPWENKLYLAALGVGVGSSLGFMFPFMNTPAYYCHHVGKVPKVKMALYSFPSVWLCLGVLWFSLCYWGPYLWDPEDKGIMPVPKPLTSLGLISAAGGGGALPPAGGGGGAPPAGGGGGAPPAEGGGGAPPADGGGDAPPAPPDEGGGAPPAAPEEAPPAPAPEEG